MVKPLSEKKITKLSKEFNINREFLATFLQSYGTTLYRKHLRSIINALISGGIIDTDSLYEYVLKKRSDSN